MDHWKQQPDKGRQQQQHQPQHNLTHKNQTKTTSDHNSTKALNCVNSNDGNNSSTDPIQSIANVLNHHSKFVQQQKKSQQLEQQASKNKLDQSKSGSGATGNHQKQQTQIQRATATLSQESDLTTTIGSSQVNQGNSYLYAYNDFVASTARGLKDSKLAASVHRAATSSKQDDSVGVSCNHHQIVPTSNFAADFNQESVTDSDEDDALSYILHQHRPQHDIQCHSKQHLKCKPDNHLDYHYSPYDSNLNSFEIQRIDHHLSCSRSSHPRHICGIGGSQNGNLNHIAARLREESQRAFVLNQKPRHSENGQHKFASNDIAAIQANQFTHDLKIIQDQLACKSSTGTVHHNHQRQFSNNEDTANKISPDTSHLNSSSELHLISSAIENPAFQRHSAYFAGGDKLGESVSDSISSSDHQSQQLTSQDNLAISSNSGRRKRTNSRLHQQNPTGYLSWLFCCLCNLIGANSSSPINRQQSHLSHSLVKKETNVSRKRRYKGRGEELNVNESPGIVGMYTPSQQIGCVGQLGGQAGAYYATQAPQSSSDAALHQSSYYAHNHHHQQHHQYPLSSDSSMGSSAFATSALRMNAFLKSCCSKKCLFVSCLMLILLIFIFVIGLSAYLNFLINSNKTNLTPLSGRLKVDSQGDMFNDQLLNRTSKEFLAKQQQYETILRGAFDRTQNLLKSYPNHLVKCEVYSFKQGSLWVYFRLFINKRTLMHDTQLMKRKSPDEHVDKQFLPRLTQQTLHSGFEQLITAFNRDLPESRRSRASSQTADLRRPRAIPEASRSVSSSQREHVKSFDDQISRLMPIIESIDLQSIQVTPEFDMLQSVVNSASQQESMSDNLRASQFLTTASSVIMVATGGSNDNRPEIDIQTTTQGSSRSPTARPSSTVTWQPETELSTVSSTPGSMADEINVSTKKFTLYGYKENATRPTTSIRPTINQPPNQQDSPFLVNHQQKKPIVSVQSSRTNGQATSNTLREIVSSRPPTLADVQYTDKVVRLVSGQPVVSQNGQHQRGNAALRNNPNQNNPNDKSINNKPTTVAHTGSSGNRNITLFVPLSKSDQFSSGTNLSTTSTSVFSDLSTTDNGKSAIGQKDRIVNETVVMQMVAPYQKIEFSQSQTNQAGTDSSSQIARRPSQREESQSIQELWNNALNNNSKKNITFKTAAKPEGEQQQQSTQLPKRLITLTTVGGDRNQQQTELQPLSNNNNSSNSSDGSGSEWQKISVLSSDISDTIRAQLNASLSPSTTPQPSNPDPDPSNSVAGNQQKPKISPHLKQGGSLISTVSTSTSSASRQQQHRQEPSSAVILNKDFLQTNHHEGQLVSAASNSTKQTVAQQPRVAQPSRSDKRKANSSVRNSTSGGLDQHKQHRTTKPTTIKQHKLKKVSEIVAAKNTSMPVASNSDITSANGTLINSRGIKIVDNFLTSIDSNLGNITAAQVAANSNGRSNLKNKTQEAFNYNADHMMPTLPTTIELTRSTTLSPLSRTTSNLQHHQAGGSDSLSHHGATPTFDHSPAISTSTTTQRYSPSLPLITTTESPFITSSRQGVLDANNNFLSNQTKPLVPVDQRSSPSTTLQATSSLFNQQSNVRPGTTRFSNQWKPLAHNQTNLNNHSTRKPNNLALIIPGTERLPPTVNIPSNQGSQSPFAMSTAILSESPRSNIRSSPPTLDGSMSSPGRLRNNKLTNSYHVVVSSGASRSSSGNEFESHRMSRMSQASTESGLNAQSSTQALSTSTVSSLNIDPDTRIVDEFMITTDRIESNTRGSTLLPPLVSSSMQQVDPIDRIRAANTVDIQPKRTRGPFAFETLKTSDEPTSFVDILSPSSQAETLPANRRERSPTNRLAQANDQKLLVRKKLFLGVGDDEDELSSASSIAGSTTTSASNELNEEPQLDKPDQQGELGLSDRFGNRKPARTKLQLTDTNINNDSSFRCPHYGCKAKGLPDRFICLNHTQICDDFIDCHDESDELDCVSLLKYDVKSNGLTFSNGNGIIYLNRKGSLAPMCIDYYSAESAHHQPIGTGTAHDLDTIQLDMIKKQQELIRQINTIGQYACSLQSFSRLVSVKINHHDLVDGLDLIKTSKLYHRLSIVRENDKR